MKPFYVREFANSDQCNVLARWIAEHFHRPFFRDANMHGKRLTTRYSRDGFQFPKESYDLQASISSSVAEFDVRPAPFKDGMVASYAYPGDTCYRHVDPVWHEGTITVHCNMVVSSPDSGGDVVIAGDVYEMPKGDLICYPVSHLPHEVRLVQGFNPRLMWVWGFCLPESASWDAFRQSLERIKQ